MAGDGMARCHLKLAKPNRKPSLNASSFAFHHIRDKRHGRKNAKYLLKLQLVRLQRTQDQFSISPISKKICIVSPISSAPKDSSKHFLLASRDASFEELLKSYNLPTCFGKTKKLGNELAPKPMIENASDQPSPPSPPIIPFLSQTQVVDGILENHSFVYSILETSKLYMPVDIMAKEKKLSLKQERSQIYTDSYGQEHQVLEKYWRARHLLFEKFDHGIEMDEEGWYSVTPQVIAAYTARSVGAVPLVIDAFCGVGGNSIQFALGGSHVLAIDMNVERLSMAQRNAEVYGVEEYIDFVGGDWFDICQRIRADVVFLSPPWGGPTYLRQEQFDLCTMLPLDGIKMLNSALMVSPKVILYLPKTTAVASIGYMLSLVSVPIKDNFALDYHHVNGHLKALSVYIERL